MDKIKSGIPRTSSHNRLVNIRWDIGNGVFGQMNYDLQWSGVKMIALPIDSATLVSKYGSEVCDLIREL